MYDRVQRLGQLYSVIFIVFSIFFLAFQKPITTLLDLPSIIDEILQLLMLIAIAIKSIKDEDAKFILKAYIASFLVLFVISFEAFSHRGLSLVLQQIYVHLKYILYIGFLALFVKRDLSKSTLNVIMLLSLIFFIFDLLFPGNLTTLFEQSASLRDDIPRPIGLQAHTGTLGYTVALAAIYFCSSNPKLNGIFKYALMAVFAVLVILTTVRSALVVFPLMVLWRFKKSFKEFAIMLPILLLALIPLKSTKYANDLIEMTASNIELTVDEPQKGGYIRGIMIYFSFELATDRFPFGTGAATYGTVKSDDSNIYAEIGMQNSRFFIEKDGIYDSNFASLLGELGYIFMLLYYGLFIYFCLKMGKFANEKTSSEFQFVLISMFILYSVTNPVFMNTYQVFMFGLVLIAGKLYKAENK